MKKVMELVTAVRTPPQRDERAPLQEGPPVYRDQRPRPLRGRAGGHREARLLLRRGDRRELCRHGGQRHRGHRRLPRLSAHGGPGGQNGGDRPPEKGAGRRPEAACHPPRPSCKTRNLWARPLKTSSTASGDNAEKLREKVRRIEESLAALG